MSDLLQGYLLFIGSGLYLVSFVVFFYLWLRTIRVHDGVGLVFLKVLTIGTSVGSLVVFAVRVLSEYGPLDVLDARAIAAINPLILVTLGLYLNYLFHRQYRKKK